jgi:hypothetical protein
MMGRQDEPAQLFYKFSLDRHVPATRRMRSNWCCSLKWNPKIAKPKAIGDAGSTPVGHADRNRFLVGVHV